MRKLGDQPLAEWGETIGAVVCKGVGAFFLGGAQGTELLQCPDGWVETDGMFVLQASFLSVNTIVNIGVFLPFYAFVNNTLQFINYFIEIPVFCEIVII